MTGFIAVLSIVTATNIYQGVSNSTIIVELVKQDGTPSDSKEVLIFTHSKGESRFFIKMKSLGKGVFRYDRYPDSMKKVELDIRNKNNSKIVRVEKRPKKNLLEIKLTKEEEERKDDTLPKTYSQFSPYCPPIPRRVSKWVPETCERSDGTIVYRPVYETRWMEYKTTIPPQTRFYYPTRYSAPYYYPRPAYYPYYPRPTYYTPSGRGTAFFPLFR